jgi:hydrogenase expression/formation protein HypC
MCLAIPVQVKNIQGDEAEVAAGGTIYKANICLTPRVKVGDYVLLHTGYAISVIDPIEAEKTLALFREIEESVKDE